MDHERRAGNDAGEPPEAIQQPRAAVETPAPELPILTDETAAAAARARYRTEGMTPMPADERIGPHLEPGEHVLALRDCVAIERRQRPAARISLEGGLYVTSERLIHVGERTVAVQLDDIDEIALSGRRILLILHDGSAIALEAELPHLLRVQISAARAARVRRPGTPRP